LEGEREKAKTKANDELENLGKKIPEQVMGNAVVKELVIDIIDGNWIKVADCDHEISLMKLIWRQF
jgi:hypothetical protein